MDEYGGVNVEGSTISNAMKKLDELFDRVVSDSCNGGPDLTKDGYIIHRMFFDSGAYYGAKMMAEFLFGTDFKIVHEPRIDRPCGHRLEVDI